MAEINFEGVTSPTDWLNRVFRAALDNGWTDLQFRLERDRSDIVALGQEGESSRLTVRARIRRLMLPLVILQGRSAEIVVTRIKTGSSIGSGPAVEVSDGLYVFEDIDPQGKVIRKLDVRVAVFPTYSGETITLRLPSSDQVRDISDLRLTEHNAALVHKCLGFSNGLTLLAGPMNSGKSTTLRAFLKAMGGPEKSVWAVEDPVELTIDGVEQISINAGAGNGWPEVLTGLRRSDLEVLMIGEVRNYEQATAALEIGNAGAQVLSSIHANDSVSAVMQLMELAEAKPHTLGAQLRSVVSQRLLRSLCPQCDRGNPNPKCPTCDGTGYSGLRPIHEVLIVSPEFVSALAANEPVGTLHRIAQEQGMRSLRHTANELVAEGVTSIQEVRRVLGYE